MMGREAVKIIIDRTNSGQDLNGRSFKEYSDEYTNSEEFRAWKGTGTVNLRLTGDMQESLHVESTFGRDVIISFQEELEAAKGHGHQYGSNNLPRRRWFGLSGEEENRLIEKYKRLQEQFDQQNIAELLSVREEQEQEQEQGVFIENVAEVNDGT